MKANFNNEVIGSGVKLINGASNVFQIASTIIVVANMGYRIAKNINRKRKQTKNVETEDIETTEE
jgi:hypothetical protein